MSFRSLASVAGSEFLTWNHKWTSSRVRTTRRWRRLGRLGCGRGGRRRRPGFPAPVDERTDSQIIFGSDANLDAGTCAAGLVGEVEKNIHN